MSMNCALDEGEKKTDNNDTNYNTSKAGAIVGR